MEIKFNKIKNKIKNSVKLKIAYGKRVWELECTKNQKKKKLLKWMKKKRSCNMKRKRATQWNHLSLEDPMTSLMHMWSNNGQNKKYEKIFVAQTRATRKYSITIKKTKGNPVSTTKNKKTIN